MPVGFGGQGVTVDESFVDKLVGLLDDAISRSKTEKAFVFSKRWGGRVYAS